MTRTTDPQYARLELPVGNDVPLVHCPVCGQSTFDIDAGEVTPCGHLVFMYVGMNGDFEFRTDDFCKRTESVDWEEAGFDSFPQILESAGYDGSFLALEISYGGMACGPVGSTDVFGFDFGGSVRDEDS